MPVPIANFLRLPIEETPRRITQRGASEQARRMTDGSARGCGPQDVRPFGGVERLSTRMLQGDLTRDRPPARCFILPGMV